MVIKNASSKVFWGGARKMEEREINRLLQNQANFQGTFAVNEVNEIDVKRIPALAIINLGDRKSDGSHWIGIAVYLKTIFVCDSLGGLLPTKQFPFELTNFLGQLAKTRKLVVSNQLQHTSSGSCGLFAVAFVQQMSLNNSFFDFICCFSRNLVQNDPIVKFLLAKRKM